MHLCAKGDLMVVFRWVRQKEKGACFTSVLGESVVEDQGIMSSLAVGHIVSSLIKSVCLTFSQLDNLLHAHVLQLLHHFWLTLAGVIFIAAACR